MTQNEAEQIEIEEIKRLARQIIVRSARLSPRDITDRQSLGLSNEVVSEGNNIIEFVGRDLRDKLN